MKQIIKYLLIGIVILSLAGSSCYYFGYIRPNKKKLVKTSVEYMNLLNSIRYQEPIYNRDSSEISEQELQALKEKSISKLKKYVDESSPYFEFECQDLKGQFLGELKYKKQNRIKEVKLKLLKVEESHVYPDTADVKILVKDTEITVAGKKSNFRTWYTCEYTKVKGEWKICNYTYAPGDV